MAMGRNIWFKNLPAGINTIAKWTKQSAEKIGIDTKRCKITNHSNRATTVTQLLQSGIGEQQAMKITGHGSSNSMKPYLQLSSSHHQNIINNFRSVVGGSTSNGGKQLCPNNNNCENVQHIVYNKIVLFTIIHTIFF